MNAPECYEQYPRWIVAISVGLSLAIYAIGAVILARFGILYLIAFLAYCAWVEFKVMKTSCVRCYYYGKRCGTGKGILCSLFLKKIEEGDRKRTMTWKDLLPDLLVFLFPFVGALILMWMEFRWLYLFLLILLIALAFNGNGYVRKNLLCRYCRQKILGCPAAEFFQSHVG